MKMDLVVRQMTTVAGVRFDVTVSFNMFAGTVILRKKLAVGQQFVSYILILAASDSC